MKGFCMVLSAIVAAHCVLVARGDPPGTTTHHIEITIDVKEKGLVEKVERWQLPAAPQGTEKVAIALVGGDLKLQDEDGEEVTDEETSGVRFHSALVQRVHEEGEAELDGTANVDADNLCTTHTLLAHHNGMEQTRFKDPFVVKLMEEQELEFTVRIEALSSLAARSFTVRYSLRTAVVPVESSDVKFVHPAFLPVGGCGKLFYSVEANGDDYHYEYSDAVLPFDGEVVYSLGFLDRGGDNIYVQHRKNGRVIYAGDAVYEKHALAKVSYSRDEMSVKPGDSFRVASIYRDQDTSNAFGWVMLYVRGSAFDDEVTVSKSASGFKTMEKADPGPTWLDRAGLPILFFTVAAIMAVCIGFGLATGAKRAQRARFNSDLEEEVARELENRRSLEMEAVRPMVDRGHTTVFDERSTSLDEGVLLDRDEGETPWVIE